MPDAADRPRSIRAALMHRCRDYPCTLGVALTGGGASLLLYIAQALGHG